MKDKNVTISLNEYKDLLLKERPSDNDKWLLEKFKDFLASNAVLNGNNIEIKKYQDFEEKTLDFIKMIDFDFYKQIVKKCYDNEIERQENKLKIDKMNKIKELNKEDKNENNNK